MEFRPFWSVHTLSTSQDMISNRFDGTAGDVGGRGAAAQARSCDRRLVRQRAALLLRQNQRFLRRRAAAVARASSRYAAVLKTQKDFGVGSGVGPFYHSILYSFLHPEWPLHAAVAFTKH
jgi:hypothetical protein